MKIEVKIMEKDSQIWSYPVPIEEFINNPYDIEFMFPDDELGYTTLPYKDFLFFGSEYYYEIFIDGKTSDEFMKYIEELKEYKWKYEELSK